MLSTHRRNTAGMDRPGQESGCGVLLGVPSRSHLTASLPCPLASWLVQKWGRDLSGDDGDQAGILLKASLRETAPCLDPYLSLSQEGFHSWQVLRLGASVIWGQAVPRILSDTRISFVRQCVKDRAVDKHPLTGTGLSSSTNSTPGSCLQAELISVVMFSHLCSAGPGGKAIWK